MGGRGLLGRPGAARPRCPPSTRACSAGWRSSARSSPTSTTSRSWRRWRPRTTSIAAEVEDQRASIDSRLAALEEARLFSGEYDGGDAVVTVNAGAGGTDSQDWAEMLLRTEMRWADRPRHEDRAEGGLGGGGGRHQVGHVPGQGRERLRALLRREGRAPAGADLAVRLRRPPPHGVRGRGGGAASGGDRRRARSSPTTSRSTPTAPRAPAAST